LHDGYFSLYDNSSVQYFPNGQDQFAKLVKVLKNARSSIFIETYILDKGYMWDTIRQILVEKSAQGVDVRLIYDDFGSMLNIEENYPETLQQLGIQTRTFNPMTPTLAVSMNNRDHRKTIIVDSMYAFTGGSNIADEYINKKERFGYWKDMGAMVMGKGVEPFIISFLQMWNYGIDQPTPYAPFLKNPALFSQLHEPGYVIPFFDSPTDHNNVGRDFHMNMLIQAKETFWISTPYLVLDDEMIATFELAVKNGVDVRVIIPGIPDKKMVYAVSLANAQILTSKGVKVYTYTPGFNHGKVAISDHTHALTGTVNMDFRSYFQNYECGVWMYKVPAIADIEKDFEQMFADSKLLTKEDFASTKPLVRLYRDTLKIFSPLL
jgi:cardiolipin synthase